MADYSITATMSVVPDPLKSKGSCPIAEGVARRVLTLPTYYGLAMEDVKTIAKNVLEMV